MLTDGNQQFLQRQKGSNFWILSIHLCSSPTLLNVSSHHLKTRERFPNSLLSLPTLVPVSVVTPTGAEDGRKSGSGVLHQSYIFSSLDVLSKPKKKTTASSFLPFIQY